MHWMWVIINFPSQWPMYSVHFIIPFDTIHYTFAMWTRIVSTWVFAHPSQSANDMDESASLLEVPKRLLIFIRMQTRGISSSQFSYLGVVFEVLIDSFEHQWEAKMSHSWKILSCQNGNRIKTFSVVYSQSFAFSNFWPVIRTAKYNLETVWKIDALTCLVLYNYGIQLQQLSIADTMWLLARLPELRRFNCKFTAEELHSFLHLWGW